MTLDTFKRDDRDDVKLTINGLNDLAMMGEAILIMEKYGLSIIFHEDELEFEAFDSSNYYSGRAYTPVGAIIIWDENRKEGEEQDGPRPKLRIVKDENNEE
jgi:hypothetical protein